MAMSIATNQVINNYYDLYRENEIVFTKDILRSLKIDPRQLYVKCAGSQWPCIINSTSFQMAKIIIGTAGGAFQQITKKDAPPVNLRYCFIEQNGQPMIFFVSCRVTDVTPYMNSKELAIVTLTFTQRPPDDLIYKLGTLIAANEGFVQRKEDRIAINDNTIRKLGIDKKETIIFIQNVPRRCILWNISFSGSKVILMGVPKFLENKACIIRFLFSEPNEVVDIKGMIVKAEAIDNRKDLVSVGIKYDEDQVPLAYKIRINDYLSLNRKSFLEANAIQPQQTEEVDESQINAPKKIAPEGQDASENQSAPSAAGDGAAQGTSAQLDSVSENNSVASDQGAASTEASAEEPSKETVSPAAQQ